MKGRRLKRCASTQNAIFHRLPAIMKIAKNAVVSFTLSAPQYLSRESLPDCRSKLKNKEILFSTWHMLRTNLFISFNKTTIILRGNTTWEIWKISMLILLRKYTKRNSLNFFRGRKLAYSGTKLRHLKMQKMKKYGKKCLIPTRKCFLGWWVK